MSDRKTETKQSETTTPATISTDRELVITRVIDAPREAVFKAWTVPELLKQWFAPRPWTTPVAELDVRPGGSSLIVMRSPEGKEHPGRGVYLEVVKNERLVFTDAYTKAWEPSEKPFMTVTVTLEDLGGKTRYTARVSHWTVGDRETHEKMGFSRRLGSVRRSTCYPRDQRLRRQKSNSASGYKTTFFYDCIQTN